jgi:gas vesicle protein
MSEAVLNALERDVEQARAKFANDLARLRSPANLVRLKDDLWADAREVKDEVIDKAKDAAQDGAQRLLAELKARVAANPLATMAIGAGLAWRLVHRPPIATVLIGLGLIGLARTAPSQRGAYTGINDEDPAPLRHNELRDGGQSGTETFADAAKEILHDWSAQASDTARDTAAQIADRAASVADRASDALHDAREAARDTVTQVTEKAGAMAARASQTLRDAVPDRDERDAYLLGAAALAVAAAVGIAYQRRDRRDA